MSRRSPALAVGLTLLLAGPSWAETVVGLRDAHEDVFVAVRGRVPAGTIITGVSFHSNDATVFPQIALMQDESAGRLPEPGNTLRSLQSFQAQPGSNDAIFDAYEVTEDEYLWALIRFPDNSPLVAEGANGGPGITWRDEQQLDDERSFYSVEGTMNEFSPALGILLEMEGGGAPSKTSPIAEPRADAAGALHVRAVPQANSQTARVAFRVQLDRPAPVSVTLFDVTGRRITTLASSADATSHEILWDGRSAGRRVSAGVYFYRAQAHAHSKSGKFVYVR